MRFLLDTHAFLWLVGEPQRMPKTLLRELADSRNEIWVSSACAMEVATKVRLGKLDMASHLTDPTVWRARVDQIGGQPLGLSVEHALKAGSLEWGHRDPFDRFLAAQAIIDTLVLVTRDPAFAELSYLQTHWG
jgi:PIN domain nuclease of toxin-antitoxin system